MGQITYFANPGAENTEACLDLALHRAKAQGIATVVLASTSGALAVRAGEKFRGSDVALIVVGHQYGRKAKGQTEFTADHLEQARALGVRVHFATDLFTATVGAFREKFGGGFFGIVADTLRMFGQGVKVAVEIAVMACDAGLISAEDEVVAVAGTHSGADTVLVLQPANTPQLFTTRIKEIVAKPR